MAQQQYQSPQLPTTTAPFSPHPPTPSSESPGGAQNFALPPNKRQKLSPDPRPQPGSPYVGSPYSASPINTAPPSASSAASPHFNNISLPTNTSTPTSANPSPHFGHVPLPTNHIAQPSTNSPLHFNVPSLPNPSSYNTPYGNGTTTPIAPPPQANPLNNSGNGQYQNNNGQGTPNYSPNNQHPPNYPQQPPGQPLNGQIGQQNGFQNGLQPNNQFIPNFNPAAQGTGTMGPPSKPAERENANDDQTDVLANAGVDLRAEETYAMSFYTGSYNSQPSFSQANTTAGGHAFTQFGPGDSSSFYGAGPANQIGDSTDKAGQDKLEKKTADTAWAAAAQNLARSREHELKRPKMNVSMLWRKMDKIARDNGLVLNTDAGKMPTLKLASDFRAEVNVNTAVGPNGAISLTCGSFLPLDTALADQLALMSLATNQRVRILLEEAVAVTRSRRTSADGVIPKEWVDAAAQTQASSGTLIAEGSPQSGWESAVSPITNPLKTNRLPTPVSDRAKTPSNNVTRFKNEVTNALREVATRDRELEEARLQKRLDRSSGISTRPGSVAPGTPSNSVAPEPSAKPLSKKEREKQDKGKQNTVENHAQANATMNTFLGGKKKNKYSWMTGGGGGSGANTPGRITTQGLPGTPGVAVGIPEKIRLTADGTNRMGGLREDDPKNRNVEMRDWVLVLENDGRETKSLQLAYAALEPARRMGI